jgi:diadenosine tetraphosphatase ApaH/serine/threonine PP2A family protein phosphatase
VRYHRSGITREALNKGITRFDPEQKYIFNIGSVGQPRDGTSEAKYVVWDTIHYTLDLRCIPYDVKTVAQKILAVGLPKSNAARLLAYIAE